MHVRALPGRIYRQGVDGCFYADEINKVHCGASVRVTSLKMGDIRMMQDVVIMRVRGEEFAVPVQRIQVCNYA